MFLQDGLVHQYGIYENHGAKNWLNTPDAIAALHRGMIFA
jgi:hypothetical protein